MKKIVLYFFVHCVISNLTANAQNFTLPHLRNVLPYKIQVTDKATTIIAFPYSILDADCGISELRAEKVPGMANILKVKATDPNIETTSLHVFTGDGRFYVFQVTYASAPEFYSYDLRSAAADSSTLKSILKRPPNDINEKELAVIVEKVRTEANFLRRKKRKFHMKVHIEGLYIHNNILLVKFGFKNSSRLAYEAVWVNMYMQDKKVAQRSSVQRLPMQAIYMDELPDVEGDSGKDWILAIPKTTIPDNKELMFEMQEKNGSRNISITIKNRDILRAKSI